MDELPNYRPSFVFRGDSVVDDARTLVSIYGKEAALDALRTVTSRGPGRRKIPLDLIENELRQEAQRWVDNQQNYKKYTNTYLARKLVPDSDINRIRSAMRTIKLEREKITSLYALGYAQFKNPIEKYFLAMKWYLKVCGINQDHQELLLNGMARKVMVYREAFGDICDEIDWLTVLKRTDPIFEFVRVRDRLRQEGLWPSE